MVYYIGYLISIVSVSGLYHWSVQYISIVCLEYVCGLSGAFYGLSGVLSLVCIFDLSPVYLWSGLCSLFRMSMVWSVWSYGLPVPVPGPFCISL